MTEHDAVDAYRAFLARESNRGLGDIPLRRTAALSPFSLAQMTAATNLFDKALRALEIGDEARARRLVERAVALPFDEHEGVHPAPTMAHQQMFDIVTDAYESGGDEWFDAGVDSLASAPEEARFSIRRSLSALLQDYEVTDRDRRRVRRLLDEVPERAELAELGLPPDQLATAVLEVLEGVVIFADAYDEILALTDDEYLDDDPDADLDEILGLTTSPDADEDADTTPNADTDKQ